jgi:hypothetical protein
MIVEIKQPSPLLARDGYSFSILAPDTKKYLQTNAPNYSLSRYGHKVAINFNDEADAIMFKLAFSESLM